MKKIFAIAAVFLLALAANGLCQPKPDDFAYGIALTTPGDSAIYRFEIPEMVYKWVISPSLKDVRVFNGGGQVVPHTLLNSPPLIKSLKPVYTEKNAPMFPVFAASDGREGSMNIHIETSATGAVVDIAGAAPEDGDTYVSYYILDMSSFRENLELLALDWSHGENGFVTKVDVFASSNLSDWRRIARDAALTDMSFGEHKLFRNTIELPGRRDKYLKITWPKGRDGAVLKKVTARFRKERKTVTKAPRSRTMDLQAALGEPREYLFRSPGLLPVNKIQVILPQKNTLVKASLYNRSSEKDPWSQVYSGLIYDLTVDGTRLANDDIVFLPQSKPYWRLVVDQGEGGMGPGLPVFKIGYSPHTLCFVAQGEPPFVLAFGSATHNQGDALVDPLLSGLSLDKMPDLIKPAQLGPKHELGGENALKAPKKPLPLKRIALWAILCLGVFAVGFMAWRLFRQLPEQK
ncbi:MAG: DUF3999 domain-containing protein [Desulfatibacillum sp.]|nr:DUF3999 domain-containing protein [Desulfatibacillum sp.]